MIGRPHIEFVQAQMMPWLPIGPGATRPGVEYKILSRDPGTGACSVLMRYPEGWRREGEEHITATEEIYVLDGELIIGDVSYGADCYAYLPAGWVHSNMSAPAGAVVLAFYDAEPNPKAGQPQTPADVASAIERIDAAAMPWDMTLNDPHLAHLGISRKNLRTDPLTGERTFLSLILPHSAPPGGRGPQELHPCVEESYVLSGAIAGPHGVMYPGAYFWRPPGIPHGPFGARWGAVSFMRFVGGRHINVWSSDETPFDSHPAYAPVAPPEMAAFVSTPYAPPPIW